MTPEVRGVLLLPLLVAGLASAAAAAGPTDIHVWVTDLDGTPLDGVVVELRLSPRPGAPPCRRLISRTAQSPNTRLAAGEECGGGRWDGATPLIVDLGAHGETRPARFTVAPKSRDIRLHYKAAGAAGWRPPGCVPPPPESPLPAPSRAAGRVCGRVVADGRPIPFGAVSLAADERAWNGNDAFGGAAPRPGPPEGERGGARLENGRFCLEGVPPGNYRLRLAPPVVWPQGFLVTHPHLPLAYAGLKGAVEDYRLTVDAEGRASVRDARGAIRREGPEFELTTTSGRGGAVEKTLEGVLRFPSYLPIAEDECPFVFVDVVSVGVSADNVMDSRQYFRCAERGGPLERSFSLPVAQGRTRGLKVYSRGAALQSALIPLAGPGGASHGPLEAVMGPSARAEGTVRLPDGAPFRPDAAGKRRLFLRAASLWDDHFTAEADYADDEGRARLDALRPGYYKLSVEGDGPDFRWSEPAPSWAWLEAGKPLTASYALTKWTGVCVEKGPPLPPLPGIEHPDSMLFRMSYPRERWIVGVPAGEKGALRASRLLYKDEAPFAFIQNSQGLWLPRQRPGPWADLTVRVPPGRYDAYLIESSGKFATPRLRVLAVKNGVRVAEGAATNFDFSKESLRPAGAGAVAGKLLGAPRPTSAELKGAGGLAELHARLVPRLDFHDARGAYAGTAFLSLSADELGELVDGLERGNAVKAEHFADRWPYDYAMDGLPPGEYRVEAFAAGRRLRVMTLALDGRAPTRKDVVLK